MATDEEKMVMLEAIQQHGSVVRALEATGVNRSAFYRWRQEDPDYDAMVRVAVEEGGQREETSEGSIEDEPMSAGEAEIVSEEIPMVHEPVPVAPIAAPPAPPLSVEAAWEGVVHALRTDRRFKGKVLLWAGNFQQKRRIGPLTDLIEALSREA